METSFHCGQCGGTVRQVSRASRCDRCGEEYGSPSYSEFHAEINRLHSRLTLANALAEAAAPFAMCVGNPHFHKHVIKCLPGAVRCQGCTLRDALAAFRGNK